MYIVDDLRGLLHLLTSENMMSQKAEFLLPNCLPPFAIFSRRCKLYYFFLKMGQSRPLFVYFRSFHIPIQMTIIQFEKTIDGVLGTQTRGGWMEGADESTELWRHPKSFIISLSAENITLG